MQGLERGTRPRPGPTNRFIGPMALAIATVLAACADATVVPTTREPVDLAASWETASLRDVGIDPLSLLAAVRAADDIDRLRSLLVVRHGRLVLERYFHGATRETPADVRSVTKSVVGALTALALEDGALEGVDQPFTDLLAGPRPALRPEHDGITVGHLLTMSSGIEWSEAGSTGYLEWVTADDPVGYVLERALAADPGTTFAYNSGAVHLLSLAVADAAGRSLPAYADERLFGPLGITGVEWESLGTATVNGASGLDLRPRDLARFGQLYLQGGRSGDHQLLPAEWVEASFQPVWSTLGEVRGVGAVSYGRLFWIDLDRDAAFAWGFGGQYLYVVPRLDLVVVVTTEWRGVSEDVGNRWLEERAVSLIVDGVLPAVR